MHFSISIALCYSCIWGWGDCTLSKISIPMKYLFIKVSKWYWLIYPPTITAKVNVLVDTTLYSACHVHVPAKCPHATISTAEKTFLTAGFRVKIVTVGIPVFARTLQMVRHSLSYRDGACSDHICRKSCKAHVLLFVVIFCACGRRDIEKIYYVKFFKTAFMK